MTMNLQEMEKYEWVSFHEKRSNAKTTRGGALVGRYFAISGYGDKWKIYQIFGGFPIMCGWVKSLTDGAKIAQYINDAYLEYLPVWEVWTDCDLLGIARLSIPNGEAIYKTLRDMEKLDRLYGFDDFERLLKANLACQTCPTSS